MEVVDPVVFGFLAVIPGAIGQLAGATVAHGFPGDFQILRFGGVFPSAGEQAGSEHAGIVNPRAAVSDVTEAGAGIRFQPDRKSVV